MRQEWKQHTMATSNNTINNNNSSNNTESSTSVAMELPKSYRAAVAEHKTMGSGDAMAVVNQSLDRYDTIAHDAKADGAQIIVFPEWGLFGSNNPVSSRETILPFSQPIGHPGEDLLQNSESSSSSSSSIVQRLASIAKAHSIVMVANVSESTADGKIYNTEVAISETGVLLAKYHKHNPWFTKTFDEPDKEVVTFETSFGVTFGLFICYDIFCKEPQQSLKEQGVTHFCYSVCLPVDNFITRWYYQHWAKNNDATILVSNLGGCGSRIFSSSATKDMEKKESYTIATLIL
jgi:pantetheine hydrolase